MDRVVCLWRKYGRQLEVSKKNAEGMQCIVYMNVMNTTH